MPLSFMFGITVHLIIGPAGFPGIVVLFDPSNPVLRDAPLVEWQVDKAIGKSPDTATISITNLDYATPPGPYGPGLQAATLLRGWLASPLVPIGVTLLVGWGGKPEVLFKGTATRVEPCRRGHVDHITTLECSDGGGAIDVPPQGGAMVVVAIDMIIQLLVTQLKLVTTPEASAYIAARANDPRYRMPVFTATFLDDPRTSLTQLMSSLDLSWGVEHDTFFVVYDLGIRPDLLARPAPLLGPNSGLLSLCETNAGTYEFTGLTQARVVPGGPIQFANDLDIPVGPILFVESVSFSGSSESSSTMSGIARPRTPLAGAVPFTVFSGVLGAAEAL